jgi:hypothetical protein
MPRSSEFARKDRQLTGAIKKVRSELRNIVLDWNSGSYHDKTAKDRNNTLATMYAAAERAQFEAFEVKQLIASWKDLESGMPVTAPTQPQRVIPHAPECEEFALTTRIGKQLDEEFNSGKLDEGTYYHSLNALVATLHEAEECPGRHEKPRG